MGGGYMGAFLWVDLSSGQIRKEALDEGLSRDFIGGYGVGARVLYSRQKSGVDPLGSESILGFVTGPLTGTPALSGCRYTALAKSPLTGGWGDANSGGSFGSRLKFAGFDGVFVTGISAKPMYLFIDNGKAELRDATNLWGKNTYDTDDSIRGELGEGVETACIGQSGERLSLISCIIANKGSAAGRSGLGAVMGSKRLKAIAARGSMKVPVADRDLATRLLREHVAELRAAKYGGKPFLEVRRKYGTTTNTHLQSHSGDAPVKNWGGVGVVDFPDSSGLSGDAAIANLEKRVSCWGCAIGCDGVLREGTGQYKYPAGTHRVEYETQVAFGAMCLNNNTESINMANYLCDSYGLDTISGGTVIAFAIECYENGLITRRDTDGIELTWGNHEAIVAMTEKMVKREGFGDVLADGVRMAAQRIGRGAEQFAVHIGGQELAMHDPKLVMRPGQSGAVRYKMDATPGRHTQGFGPGGFRGHVINTAGLCITAYMPVSDAGKYIAGYMSAVTGWERSMGELLRIGERIANIRHAFNLREGINPLDRGVHPRIIGNPPQKAGPLAGVKIDIDTQTYSDLDALDWDRATTKPSKKKLLELGLGDVAQDLWP